MKAAMSHSLRAREKEERKRERGQSLNTRIAQAVGKEQFTIARWLPG